MKKDNRNNIRRERFIMISTSALVLTALTVTGVFMRNHTQDLKDNGYTIDFTALEDRADDKLREIAKSSDHGRTTRPATEEELTIPELEAGANDIVIPGLEGRNAAGLGKSGQGTGEQGTGVQGKGTQGKVDQSQSAGMGDGAGQTSKNTQQTSPQTTKTPSDRSGARTAGGTEAKADEKKAPERTESPESVTEQASGEEQEENALYHVVEVAGDVPVIAEDLHFTEGTMQRPVSGAPIIDYSMDHSVYFATLDQYKYNPAIIFGATQGEAVNACTVGRVINIHNDPELGHVLVLDLGDGYQAVYGQLENIEVPIGATVEAGTKLATVAAPTKYYSLEGANLYFQFMKDGESIDPNQYFQ